MGSVKDSLKNFGVTVIHGCALLVLGSVMAWSMAVDLLLSKLSPKKERSSGPRKKHGITAKHGNGYRES